MLTTDTSYFICFSLHKACEGNNEDVIKLLLKHDSSLKLVIDTRGMQAKDYYTGASSDVVEMLTSSPVSIS